MRPFRAKANTLLLADQPSTLRSRSRRCARRSCLETQGAFRPILQLLTKLDLCGDGVGGNGLSWLDGIYHDGVDTFLRGTKHRPGRGAGKLSLRSRIHRLALAPTKPQTAWAVRQGLSEWLASIQSTDSNMLILPVTGCHPRFGKCAVAGTNLKKDLPQC